MTRSHDAAVLAAAEKRLGCPLDGLREVKRVGQRTTYAGWKIEDGTDVEVTLTDYEISRARV